MSLNERMDSSPQTNAEVNAGLQRDFPVLEPVIGNVVRRDFGESRIAVGLLAITRSRRTPDSALPETHTWIQTAAVYSSDTLRFPRFDQRPENIVFKLLEMAARLILRTGNFGGINFTTHSEFSRRYRVQSFDAERTRWLFDERVLAHLASRPGLSIAAANGSLLLYRAGEELPADRLEAFFNEAVEVFRVFEAAARRPSASRAAAGTPETDAELFHKQLSAATGISRKFPAVTLADADAFLQLPPPRVFSPGIARYCKERVSPLVLIFGGVFAITSALFLMVGRDQVPWYVEILLFFFFVGGVSMPLWAFIARLRIQQLLRHGRTGIALIEAIQTSDSPIDGATRTRLDLQVEANGTVHRATCLVPGAAVDRLQADAAAKRPIAVIYSTANPARALVAEALVMAQGIG